MSDALGDAVSRWWQGWGDSFAADWVLTLLYAVAAGCMIAAWRAHARVGTAKRSQRAWLVFAALALVLSVNKQMDLQTLLTNVVRVVARENGWYEQRRGWQAAAVVASVAVTICVGAVAVWLMRRERWPAKLALLGFGVLAAFYGTRLSSFHHTDHFLSDFLVQRAFKWRHGFEAVGLSIALTAAVGELRTRRSVVRILSVEVGQGSE
ncbi:MAG: hypothetical protein AAGK78_10915 [Planctomycetota bacterium]